MERLTEWRGEHAAIVNHHENYIDRLAAYEDTGLEPGDIEIMKAANDEMRRSEESRVRLFYGTANGIQAERCAEIVKAETDCRLVVLPCKVGDTVWEIGYDCKIDYEDMCEFPAPSCDECEFVKRVIVPVRVDSVTAATFLIGKIGTTAFFSFEEAEAALKGVSEDANN